MQAHVDVQPQLNGTPNHMVNSIGDTDIVVKFKSNMVRVAPGVLTEHNYDESGYTKELYEVSVSPDGKYIMIGDRISTPLMQEWFFRKFLTTPISDDRDTGRRNPQYGFLAAKWYKDTRKRNSGKKGTTGDADGGDNVIGGEFKKGTFADIPLWLQQVISTRNPPERFDKVNNTLMEPQAPPKKKSKSEKKKQSDKHGSDDQQNGTTTVESNDDSEDSTPKQSPGRANEEQTSQSSQNGATVIAPFVL